MADSTPTGIHQQGQKLFDERCAVFAEGDDLYDAMLEEIAQAKRSIRIESYIFAGDEVGWRFAKMLAEKARSGVRVQVQVDAAGALFENTESLFRYMQKNVVVTQWFNRWRWRDPLHYNRRNHRKLLVVDETCVFLGGFNIHRQSSRSSFGPLRWRDVHVRVDNCLGGQAASMFDDSWTGVKRRSAPPWQGAFRVVPNSTGSCRRVLHCMYLDALAAAKHTVYLISPYFVPDRRFRNALAKASERGVDVMVLLPAVGDKRLVRWAGHALARPLTRRGVQFFEYLPRMLHTKLVLIDDSWAMVGSANTDYRSFFINQELNLISRAPWLCQQLKSIFLEDLDQSRRWDSSVPKLGSFRALAEAVGHRLRRWF